MADEESMYDEGDFHFEIEACWERSADRYRCRWCVVSCILNEDDYGRIAGVAAGWSGAGFQLERFYVEIDDDGEASKLIIEAGFDAVSDPDREGEGVNWFEEMDAEVQEAAEAAYTLLFRWNDSAAWDDGDEVVLRGDKGNDSDLHEADDMLLLRTDDEPYPRWVCDAIGLTAKPVFDDDD